MAMLVATRHDLALVHARFRDLPHFLSAGDLLVVNASATLPAALEARLGEQQLQLWLSTPTTDGGWLVELRTSDRAPHLRPPVGARLDLPGGAHAELLARFAGSDRLAVARFELDEPLEDYLRRHGQPIRYGYVPEPWPLDAYQTVFALEPGSAEMPSAGRPFTAELVTELVARGVLVAPVTLHTGRLLARARRAALPRALPRPGRDSQARQRRPRLERARDRGRHDCCARARDGGRSGPHGVGGSGLDEPRRHARARAARDRRPPHRVCTNANPHTSSCSRPRPVPSSSSAPTRPRSSTATSGTSSATST